MLDYLIARKWVVSEDRSVNLSGPGKSRGPTSWAGINYGKLAFLLMGYRTDPTRYAGALAQAGRLADTAWVGIWTSTFGIDHYYKFNLLHTALYNYFRLETDATRWRDLRRAFAITVRYVKSHRNAHFDLVRATVDPSTKTLLFPAIREALREVADSPHRYVGPAVVDLSGVTWVNLKQFGYSNGSSSAGTVSSSTRRFPTEPLHMTLRRPTGHFCWQRDPFTPTSPNAGDPTREKIGLGLLLPYWMGRHYGAF